MRVFWNECYKLLTAPIFIAVTLIAFMFTLYSAIGSKPIQISDSEYRAFHSEVSNITEANEKTEYIQNLLEQEMQSDNRDLQWRDHIDFYNAELEQAQAVRDYKTYLSDIRESAESMTGISIFAEKDSYTYRNAVSIPKSYEQVSSVCPSYLNSESVLLALNNRIIDIVLILVLFTAVFILIGKERETGIMGVIKPLKKGRTYLCSTKIFLVLLTAIVLGIILYAEVLLVGALRYGYTDFSSPIQSIKGYIGCNLPITVFQAIIIMIAFKVLTAFLLSMLLYLLCTRLSTVISILIVTAVIAAEYGLYSKIPFTSELSPLSAINLISFLDSANLLKSYHSINFIGYPLGYLYVAVVSLSVGIAVSFIIANLLFATMKTAVKAKSKKENRFTKYIPKNVFSYTIYKFLVLHKGLVILLIVALIQIYSAFTMKMPYDADDRWYKYYCDTLADLNESEADNFIITEDERFNALYLELVSPETSEYRINQIGNELKAKAGYELAKEQYQYIKELDSSNKAMFYLSGWNQTFGINGYREDMLHSIILLSSMCLIILPIVAYDRKRNIPYLVNATKHGRNVYFRHNMIFASIISAFLSILCYIPNFLAIISVYGSDGINHSIRCIPVYEALVDIPIWCYFMLVILVRTFITILISMVMVYLSSISNSPITSLILGIIIFVLPILIYLIGFTPALDFCSPLSVNHEWIERGTRVLVNVVMYIGLSIFSILRLERKNNI